MVHGHSFVFRGWCDLSIPVTLDKAGGKAVFLEFTRHQLYQLPLAVRYACLWLAGTSGWGSEA